MENDNLGPVGVRDYPPGCIPPARRSQGSQMGIRPVVGASQGGVSETPLLKFPDGFESWDSREQFVERRRKFDIFRREYERQKENGEPIPRPDLTALKQMRQDGLAFNFKDIGEVPGVIVGDTFDYRSEMFVVGLHCAVQAGIAYAELGGQLLATSIVASGGYEDDKDSGDVLEYSGQGGNDYKGEKRQVGDQKRRGGNEAMMNSYQLQKPVRVIRGHDVDTTNGWNKTYSYDGLYSIINANLEVGASGHKVYKFKLRRNPGQPELSITPVHFRGAS